MKALISTVVALLACSGLFGQQEIAQWRGPSRNGVFPESNLLTHWPENGPELLWKFDDLGRGYASASVTSDKVYTVGLIDKTTYAFCFDLKGKLLWKKPLGPDYTGQWAGTYSTPTICDGAGYVVNSLGVLYAFSASSGDVLWKNDLIKTFNGPDSTEGFLDNLILSGDTLFCTPRGGQNNLVALNKKNGQLIWASRGQGQVKDYTSPVLIKTGNKSLYVNQTASSIFAVDTKNGQVVWSYRKPGEASPNTPIFVNNLLYSIDGKGSLTLKLSEDGKQVTEAWKNPDLFSMQGDAVVIGDRIYGRGRNKMTCADLATGKTLFSEPLKSPITTIIAADKMLYCYDFDGKFYLLKPLADRFEHCGSFVVRGGSEEHCSHPVIKDGRLYIRHDNSLFVYQVSDGTRESSEPVDLSHR